MDVISCLAPKECSRFIEFWFVSTRVDVVGQFSTTERENTGNLNNIGYIFSKYINVLADQHHLIHCRSALAQSLVRDRTQLSLPKNSDSNRFKHRIIVADNESMGEYCMAYKNHLSILLSKPGGKNIQRTKKDKNNFSGFIFYFSELKTATGFDV